MKKLLEKIGIYEKCPQCQGSAFKVIYYGLPLKLCKDESCSCLFGFWHFIAYHLPFNGFFYIYEDNYFSALFRWLTTGWND